MARFNPLCTCERASSSTWDQPSFLGGWTSEGWLYPAVIPDLYSRVIVGWATSERIDARLVCTAVLRALWQYRPGVSVIFHIDRGSQYTSRMFRDFLAARPVQFIQSNGLSCYNNAVTEPFFHTLKTESVDFEQFQSRAGAHHHQFDYIESFHNQKRLHSLNTTHGNQKAA